MNSEKKIKSHFIYVCSNIDSTSFLKQEIRTKFPFFTPAYSRKGFITFKHKKNLSMNQTIKLSSVFARIHGITLFKSTVNDFEDKLCGLMKKLHNTEITSAHIFPRDPEIEALDALKREICNMVKKKFSSLSVNTEKPDLGKDVIDIVIVDKDEIWTGIHRHNKFHSPFPGGIPEIEPVPHIPSRAYFKMKEALMLTGTPVRKGDTAVEIGSSPGGTSLCLLEKGVNVAGIDPGDMDDICLGYKQNPWFRHFRCTTTDVKNQDIEFPVEWIVLDINANPFTAINRLMHIYDITRHTLLGCFLTLKMNNIEIIDKIPSILDKIKKRGLKIEQAKQLYFNKREIFVFATTKKCLSERRQQFPFYPSA